MDEIYKFEDENKKQLIDFLTRFANLFPYRKIPRSLVSNEFTINQDVLINYLNEIIFPSIPQNERSKLESEIPAFCQSITLLTKDQRELIFYLFLQNYSEEKVAQHTNFSKQTIQRRRKQILQILSTEMYFLKKDPNLV